MAAVMSLGKIAENGSLASQNVKSPSKSLTPSRIGRRNQETKDEKSSYICPLCDKICTTQHQLTMHIRQDNYASQSLFLCFCCCCFILSCCLLSLLMPDQKFHKTAVVSTRVGLKCTCLVFKNMCAWIYFKSSQDLGERCHNTDTGGTDHSCSICGKSLSSASSLDRHMLVHSGERPYKCSVCDQSFTTNGNMH
ncbi:hypothetical protein E2320_011095, partial [Naja naja]